MIDYAKKNVEDALEVLERKGNDTDHVLFERASRYAKSSRQTTYLSRGGIRKNRTQKDMSSDANIATELALILSWRLGWTVTFWNSAAYHVNDKNADK
jgi:hypothetical protein